MELIVNFKHIDGLLRDIGIPVRWDDLPVLKSSGHHPQDEAATIASPWTVHEVVGVRESFPFGVSSTATAVVCGILRDG